MQYSLGQNKHTDMQFDEWQYRDIDKIYGGDAQAEQVFLWVPRQYRSRGVAAVLPAHRENLGFPAGV